MEPPLRIPRGLKWQRSRAFLEAIARSAARRDAGSDFARVSSCPGGGLVGVRLDPLAERTRRVRDWFKAQIVSGGVAGTNVYYVKEVVESRSVGTTTHYAFDARDDAYEGYATNDGEPVDSHELAEVDEADGEGREIVTVRCITDALGVRHYFFDRVIGGFEGMWQGTTAALVQTGSCLVMAGAGIWQQHNGAAWITTAEKRAYFKFQNPVPLNGLSDTPLLQFSWLGGSPYDAVHRALLVIAAPEITVGINATLYGAWVTADFDPATLTWATQPACSADKELSFFSGIGQNSNAEAKVDRLDIGARPRLLIASGILGPGAAVYGVRLSFTVAGGGLNPTNGDTRCAYDNLNDVGTPSCGAYRAA